MPLSSKLSPFIALCWNEATPGIFTGHPYPASLTKWMWIECEWAQCQLVGLKSHTQWYLSTIVIQISRWDSQIDITQYHFARRGLKRHSLLLVWQRGLPETPTHLTCTNPRQDSELALLINIYQTSRSRVKVMGHPLIINGNKLTFEYQQEEGC